MDEVELENISKPRRGRPPLPRPVTGQQSAPAVPSSAAPTVSTDEDIEEGAKDAFSLYASVPEVKMRAMQLNRHYRPMGDYEIVGYMQPEITRKGPDGKETILQEAAFIPDVMAPSPMPGVANANKVWATTIIRVPVEEAKRMRANNIAERTVEDD